MLTADLIDQYTDRELQQEIEPRIKAKYSGKRGRILTELTKPQRKILQTMGIQRLGKA